MSAAAGRFLRMASPDRRSEYERDAGLARAHTPRVLTVHHLENSRSQRILWLLEELEVPYDIKRYNRNKKTMLAPEELRAIHPLGKSPLLTDGERVIAESGAIITYLIDKYGEGRFRPDPGTDARDQYEYWMHYAEGSLMPLLLLRLMLNRIKDGPVPFFVKPLTKLIVNKVDGAFLGPQLKLHLTFINTELGKAEWLTGDHLTGADIQMSFPLEAGRTRLDFSPYPNVAAFVDRVHARPAYQRALAKGGPYQYGPKK